MSIIDEARAMRASYIALAQSAPDELLSSGDYLSVFDPLCGDGGLIPARSVRRHEGNLYRANADCWDREDNWPSAAPTLWTQVTPDEWPAWVRPSGAHDAYNTGDKVTHNGKQYTSQIDGNTTEPGTDERWWSETKEYILGGLTNVNRNHQGRYRRPDVSINLVGGRVLCVGGHRTRRIQRQ